MSIDKGKRTVICSQLFETEASMNERVRKMRAVSKIKQRSKFAVVAVLSFALVASIASISTSTVEAAENYVELYDETRELTAVTSETAAQKVEFIPADQVADVTTGTLESQQISRGIGSIVDLEVRGGCRLYTSYFYCEKGGSIAVTGIGSPSDVHYYIGVEYATGYQYRLGGSGTLQYPFTADQSGYWRVFVENEGTQTVTVDGTYVYSD